MQLPPQLLRWSRAHHHLITREVWAAHGLADRTFDRAAERGELVRLRPNVVALPGAAITAETHMAAVVLSCRVPVMTSHLSSARVWDGPVDGTKPIEVITLDRSPIRMPGVVVHRPRDLVDLRPVIRKAIPTTNPLRTLTDLGASDPSVVAPVLEAFLIARYVTPAVVHAALQRHRGRGHRGVKPLHDALESLVLGDKPPDSVLEPAMGRLMNDHGLTGWTFHPRISGLEVDFAFLEHGVVIEVDGWRYHSKPASLDRDHERQAVLVADGWAVIPLTWHQVVGRGRWTAGRIRAALEGRGWRPGTP